MDTLLEKLRKSPCLVWAIALMPVLLGGLIYLLYRPKNIILFEVLNKLSGSTIVDMVRNKAEHVICRILWSIAYLRIMDCIISYGYVFMY